ncbi:uncharacterized protein LOC5509974 [Nematostella vectensis]|uniref:uncharacterized protein LOC5509974 n=1 Tax=Nematostella vectensis TaxID=45351 RepID=UPI0020773795|nr:uncharacterized protein LOC5509974 [Nematostella vectensis]
MMEGEVAQVAAADEKRDQTVVYRLNLTSYSDSEDENDDTQDGNLQSANKQETTSQTDNAVISDSYVHEIENQPTDFNGSIDSKTDITCVEEVSDDSRASDYKKMEHHQIMKNLEASTVSSNSGGNITLGPVCVEKASDDSKASVDNNSEHLITHKQVMTNLGASTVSSNSEGNITLGPVCVEKTSDDGKASDDKEREHLITHQQVMTNFEASTVSPISEGNKTLGPVCVEKTSDDSKASLDNLEHLITHQQVMTNLEASTISSNSEGNITLGPVCVEKTSDDSKASLDNLEHLITHQQVMTNLEASTISSNSEGNITLGPVYVEKTSDDGKASDDKKMEYLITHQQVITNLEKSTSEDNITLGPDPEALQEKDKFPHMEIKPQIPPNESNENVIMEESSVKIGTKRHITEVDCEEVEEVTSDSVYIMSVVQEELKAVQQTLVAKTTCLNDPDEESGVSSGDETGSDSESETSSETETSSDESTTSQRELRKMITETEENEDEKTLKGAPVTKDELTLKDLPLEPDVDIQLKPDANMVHIGNIAHIVETMVVVQSLPQTPALDIETFLFLENRHCIGRIFETFGPVQKPFYSIRFNSEEHLTNKGVAAGLKVFYVPDDKDCTKFVFVAHLEKIKGSDASWKHDQEPPEELVEFSDDEQEAQAKSKKKKERRNRKTVSQGQDGENPISSPLQCQNHTAPPDASPVQRTWCGQGRGLRTTPPPGQPVWQNPHLRTPFTPPSHQDMRQYAPPPQALRGDQYMWPRHFASHMKKHQDVGPRHYTPPPQTPPNQQDIGPRHYAPPRAPQSYAPPPPAHFMGARYPAPYHRAPGHPFDQGPFLMEPGRFPPPVSYPSGHRVPPPPRPFPMGAGQPPSFMSQDGSRGPGIQSMQGHPFGQHFTPPDMSPIMPPEPVNPGNVPK